MSRSIEIIYRKSVREAFQAYVKTFPFCYRDYSQSPSKEEGHVLLDRYEQIVDQGSENLLRAISADISAYLFYFNIQPRGSVDEFKVIYFTGRKLSRFFSSIGDPDLRRINDHTLIELLDYRLKMRFGNTRGVMSKALHKIADNNELDTQLGSHGMYLLYKCIHNALDEQDNI